MEGPHPGAHAHIAQVLLPAGGGGGRWAGLAAQVAGVLEAWPELAELRRCAPRCTAAHRWSQALSGLAAGARAALDGALLAQRARRPGIPLGEEVNLATMVLQGTACYDGVSLLLRGGLRSVADCWRMDPERVADAEARLSQVVGPPAVVGGGVVPVWGREPVVGGLQPFPLAVLLFGAALRAGWAWALALRLFAGCRVGWPCGRGRGFVIDRGKGVPPTGLDLAGRWLVSRLASQTDPGSVVTVYFDARSVVFVECSKPVFAPRRGQCSIPFDSVGRGCEAVLDCVHEIHTSLVCNGLMSFLMSTKTLF